MGTRSNHLTDTDQTMLIMCDVNFWFAFLYIKTFFEMGLLSKERICVMGLFSDRILNNFDSAVGISSPLEIFLRNSKQCTP